MNLMYLGLLFVIPMLLVVFIYYFYNWYTVFKSQSNMIEILKSSNTKILDTSRVEIRINAGDSFLQKKLMFAGFESSQAVITFIFISLLSGFVIAFFIFTVISSFIAFFISFLIFSFFPYLILVKIISSREEDFNIALKEIIDKVTSMMKSGVGFEQALKKSVLGTSSKFTKIVFDIYIKEKDIVGEKTAFEKMFKYVNSKELRIFYLTVAIGRQSGGKFSNTLEKLRKTLHDQGEIKQQITSSTREVKIGSYMIIGLVVFIYILMNNSLNNALDSHFFGSSIGKLQMFFIVIWVSFGLFINNLLTKIK